MSTPVALITGGGSGIGLSVAEHLIQFHGYKVAIADIDAERVKTQANNLGTERCLALHLDVAEYTALATAFTQTFEWGGNRLDFFFGNAGIGETDSLYMDTRIDETTGLPAPLNVRTIDVDLLAVIQGIHLARHFFAEKNPTPGGRILVTSSVLGLYALHCLPMYTAAKHALVGLVRALAPVYAKDGISINALNPSLVSTNLMPEEAVSFWDASQRTPMSTVLKAIDALMADPKMTGQTMMLELDEVVFIQQPEYARPNTKGMVENHAGWETVADRLLPRPPLQNATFGYTPPKSF